MVCVGLLLIANVYQLEAAGILSNPDIAQTGHYLDTLLLQGYCVQAFGFLVAFVGVALLHLPPHHT